MQNNLCDYFKVTVFTEKGVCMQWHNKYFITINKALII